MTIRSLDSEAVEQALKRTDLPPDVRRVLEIRAASGSASVKKLYAINNQTCRDDRLRDLIMHHGARTGRPTGKGPQPLNLPKAGPKLATCHACAKPYAPKHPVCPWCAAPVHPAPRLAWKPEMVDHVLEVMATRSLDAVEWFFGDALLSIAGCIRGLFVAGPGKVLIASDYSAIEAVVAACMAGEQWRIDTFRARRDIYLQSASSITGISYETYKAYAESHGENHPDRQSIGKVAELACLSGCTLVWARYKLAWKPRGKWRRLDEITTDWQVHDGTRFVDHEGLLFRGVKPVTRQRGVLSTDDHLFRVGRKWVRFDAMGDAEWAKAQNGIMGLFTMQPALPESRPDRPTLTYDILNAGPRHRFMIASSGGPVVVSNCGYGGWEGAWRAFDPDEANKSSDEIVSIIKKWRAASPHIEAMWGGQRVNWQPELYGVEGAMIEAIQTPGRVSVPRRPSTMGGGPFPVRVEFQVRPFGTTGQPALFAKLPSGRELTYHRPALRQSEKRQGTLAISYWTENTNPKYGPLGWVAMDTWGSRTFENLDQAIAHDIQRHGIELCKAAGYPMVLGVYDEDVFEVPEGFGSVEEVERLMATMPAWAADWPIRADGGWKGHRYRKG